MMSSELMYQIALTMIPQIGCVQARLLCDSFGHAFDIFHARQSTLEQIDGIGSLRARAIKSFSNFTAAENEMRFLEKYQILPLFLKDAAYPRRLLNCYDPPTMLYLKGQVDLNRSRILSVIGTRRNSAYGKEVTERFIAALASHQVLVVSGLAFGIDAIAHRAALANQVSTVGVLAHSLDKLYPPEHRPLAGDMLTQGGGLLTEFTSNTKPDRHHFPVRNRIVAGLCDAVLVVETGLRGGSMITAELANGYNRDVFAVPGKITDIKSAGCHLLIQQNKAILVSEPQHILGTLGWLEQETKKANVQRSLFPALNEAEQQIVAILQELPRVHIDELNRRTGWRSSIMAATLLNLELQNIIHTLPGKCYALV